MKVVRYALITVGVIALLLFILSRIELPESTTEKQNRMARAECDHLESAPAEEYLGGDYPRCLYENGYTCDYGYSEKRGACCDEDDYGCEVCASNTLDCSDFDSQERVQSVYEFCKNFHMDTEDIHLLDLDNDGVACETLP